MGITEQRPILSVRGIECGYYRWSLFNSLAEQGHRYGEYMDRIPFSSKWPLALFEDIIIQKTFRHRGLGRKGVKSFIEDASKAGAVCALLKVGWGTSENAAKARAWKTAFYKSEGFIELPCIQYEPVLMCRQLGLHTVRCQS